MLSELIRYEETAFQVTEKLFYGKSLICIIGSGRCISLYRGKLENGVNYE